MFVQLFLIKFFRASEGMRMIFKLPQENSCKSSKKLLAVLFTRSSLIVGLAGWHSKLGAVEEYIQSKASERWCWSYSIAMMSRD